MHENDLLSMLISWCIKGELQLGHAHLLRMRENKDSAYTLGIVLEKQGELRFNSSVLRKYLDSVLLWCSSQPVATTNPGKQHIIG